MAAAQAIAERAERAHRAIDIAIEALSKKHNVPVPGKVPKAEGAAKYAMELDRIAGFMLKLAGIESAEAANTPYVITGYVHQPPAPAPPEPVYRQPTPPPLGRGPGRPKKNEGA